MREISLLPSISEITETECEQALPEITQTEIQSLDSKPSSPSSRELQSIPSPGVTLLRKVAGNGQFQGSDSDLDIRKEITKTKQRHIRWRKGVYRGQTCGICCDDRGW